jgi:L-iditol 2-dehydrogenase
MAENAMTAAVYHGPDDLRVEKRPLPDIGPAEALLRVVSASICGTDLRILHGKHRKYPPGTTRIPGHEVVGKVVQVGANVKGLQVGQRVFVAPNMGCGHCRQCVSGNNNLCANYEALGVTIDGAFAEYMRIPAAAILQGNLIPLKEDIDAAVAALIEPFACVLRGQNAVNIRAGDVVLVVGAGPIGIMHTMLAQLRGASRVIVSELIPERQAQADRAGADRIVNPEHEELAAVVAEETNGNGADAILIAAPSRRAQEAALELAAIGGRINYFGGLPKDRPSITFDSNLVHYKELVVTGTTACSTNDCWQSAAIVNSGRVDLSKLISARYALHQALDAFTAAEDRKTLKVVLEPGT